MRFLNLPLVIAGLLGWWAWYRTIVSPQGHTTEQTMSEGFMILFAIFFTWLLLAVVLTTCAGLGSFKWLPAPGGSAVLVMLLLFAAVVLVALLPIGIALDLTAYNIATGDRGSIVQIGLASFGLPLALALYAGWVINAPEAVRDLPVPRYGALAAVVILGIVAARVSLQEIGRWDAAAQTRAVVGAQLDDERVQEDRRAFAALTDANSLLEWDSYAGYNRPEDIRTEALRRIALRPQLEAELAEALSSSNTLWTREALWLVATAPFKPSAALEKPLRDALAIITEEVGQRSTATVERQSGTVPDDKALDNYEGYSLQSPKGTLQSTLAVAERMAADDVDMRDAIDAMQRAAARSAKSDAARYFPGQAAAAKERIAKILAARQG
jgi:hypothetical protein